VDHWWPVKSQHYIILREGRRRYLIVNKMAAFAGRILGYSTAENDFKFLGSFKEPLKKRAPPEIPNRYCKLQKISGKKSRRNHLLPKLRGNNKQVI